VTYSKKEKSNDFIYLAWFSAALFFMYQYVLRVAPGILIHEIRHEYKITAEQFSLLGSLFYYSYSLLQIPMGIILDVIGIRYTIVISLVSCVIGGVFFAYTDNIFIGCLSRILIGAGAASAFMGALKIAADYLPEGKRGFLIGATLAMGTIGAVSAGHPFLYMVDLFGWRTAVHNVSLFGLLIMVFCWFTLPKQKSNSTAEFSFTKILSSIALILKNKNIVIYSIVAIGLYTPLAVIADLWGTAFLMEKYNIARAEAANSSMVVYIGMSLGSLILPAICEKKKIINISIKICSILILISFVLLLFGPHYSLTSLRIFLLFVGFLCGSEMICFTAAMLYTTKSNSGLTIGVVNTLNMLGGALLQHLIGKILDLQWVGEYDAFGIRYYSVKEYTVALSSILIVLVLTSTLAVFGLGRDKNK
jgi:predicted MFS family arabinose efflux permease